jgi:hypothetical protein
MNRAQLQNVLLFAVGMGLAVVILPRQAWGVWWLTHATYFIVFGVLGFWLVRLIALGRQRWTSLGAALRENWAEVLLALGAMAVLFLTHDWQFKVLSDETNFVGVGRSFAFDWRFDFPTDSKFYYGVPHYSRHVFDKRPPLFTFVLGLVNSLTGYRVRNVWFLNGGLLGATVLLTAGFLREKLGRPWNLLAVVWALANPIVMLTASAAGVEPLLCLLWAFGGVALYLLLEEATPERFQFFIATAMMLAICRLEAGPMAGIMLAGVFAVSRERKQLAEMLRGDPLVWLSPVVALPLVILRAQKVDYFDGQTQHPFALAHVAANLGNWKKALTDGTQFYPYSALVTGVEVIAFLVLVVLVIRSTTLSRAQKAAFAIFSCLTGAFAAMYSAYYWGQPTVPTSARFYALPIYFAGLTVPAVLLRVEAIRAHGAAAAVVFALVFGQAFGPLQNRAFVSSAGQRKQHAVVEDLVLPRAREKQILLVTVFPGQFDIYGIGAISFRAFKKGRATLAKELDRRLFDEVLFSQEVTFGTGKPTEATALPDDVAVEVLGERVVSSHSFMRLSRLKREATETPPVADPPKPTSAEHDRKEEEKELARQEEREKEREIQEARDGGGAEP